MIELIIKLQKAQMERQKCKKFFFFLREIIMFRFECTCLIDEDEIGFRKGKLLIIKNLRLKGTLSKLLRLKLQKKELGQY